MLYFKHQELVKKYHVSLKTVHNWIDGAKQGKIKLELCEQGNRTYVANNANNTVALERLVLQGKKYRNNRYHKVIHPTSEFYKIYSRRQILDIITNLDVHGEIPRQYNYLQEGAHNWDNWVRRLIQENTPGILRGTIELIRTNMLSIEQWLEGSKKVNIIDLGVGNAYPVKELLGRLLELGVLHRYIAIDISQEMLDVAHRNIEEWYGNAVPFEGYVRDFSYEHFDDLLVDDMLSSEAEETVNLVLLLGATPLNFRSSADIFKTVYGSMGSRDMVMYTDIPDTESTRRQLDFHPNGTMSGRLSPSHKYILDLLNIDESLYDVEMGFNVAQRMRYIRIRFNTSLSIKFRFDGSERRIDFEKGDTILLLRVWHMTAREIISSFERAGFTLLQSSLTKDRRSLLTLCGVDLKPER